jgi:hypothetical protein
MVAFLLMPPFLSKLLKTNKMKNKEYFETFSIILNNDIKRFIDRICYEAYCHYDSQSNQYLEKLERMIKNHVEKEEYEIAEGLKQCKEKIEDEFENFGNIDIESFFTVI